MRQKENKRTFVGVIVVLSTLLLVIGSCSTEKNTFINRAYHSTTARFNGLFNARELVRIGLDNYRYNAREDFSQILPIELFPNEEDVVEFYPIVDTAIAKCQNVISLHSMPTASRPSQKKTEHANYIDQNWLMIGYAYYIRRDYDKALNTFDYVRKFFEDKPSTYSAELWQIKTYIQLNQLTEARRTLQKLEVRMLNASTKSSSKKQDKAPSLPKDISFELAKTRAMLAFAEKDTQKATSELKIALEKARKKEDKARLNFIIGQLLQQGGDASAREYYTQSIRKNAPFEMSFNAKINRAVVSNLGNDEMIDELSKLAREERYLEFRDQIYFAMSKIELTRPDREMAKNHLSRSVFYSLNNDLQKGVSYEKLGDLTFEEKNYVFAQRYYDSSAQVIPDTYYNYDVIKNKADRLANLVENVQVIEFEDSVQRIAKMDEKTRENFVKDVIKQLKKEEQERKEREAIRAEQMRKLQQSFDNQNQRSGSKFYFTNAKAMQEGLEDFKRIWGQRENTDYWRLSNKPHRLTMPIDMEDTLGLDSLLVETPREAIPLDSLSVEDLLKDIPLSDSAFHASNERLLEALYSSGMIYKEQLDEVEMGATQFQRVVDHDVENVHNVMSAFQLYKIHENTPQAAPYKAYILNNYPNTDYANYLRDPDYFIKKRERDALALKDYLRSVTHFEQGLYYPVILKADMEIKEEANNPFRKEYLLLKAMAMGQVNRDKTSLLPVLEQAVEEYPNTEVATRAQEMIHFIENGLPEYTAYEAPEADLFSYSSREYYVIVELKEGQNENTFANNIANFNREYFGRLRLSSNHQMYNLEQAIVLIREFKTVGEAKAYIGDMRKARRYVTDLQSNEILLISRENFRLVMEQQKLSEYKSFHEENY